MSKINLTILKQRMILSKKKILIIKLLKNLKMLIIKKNQLKGNQQKVKK